MIVPIKQIITEITITQTDKTPGHNALVSGGLSAGVTGLTTSLLNPDNDGDTNPYLIGGAGLTGAAIGYGLSGTQPNIRNNIAMPTLAAGIGGAGVNTLYQNIENVDHVDHGPVDIPLTMGATALIGSLLLPTKKHS